MLINSFWSRLWLEQIYGWNIFMVGASMVGTFLQLEHVNSDWSSWRMVGADSWLEHSHGWSRSMVGAKRLWLVHPISRTIPDWLEQKCSTENLGWSKRSVGVNTQLDHAPTAYLLQLRAQIFGEQVFVKFWSNQCHSTRITHLRNRPGDQID